MTKKIFLYVVTLGCLAVMDPTLVQAQTCGPVNNGRLADAFYEGTVLFLQPVVEFQEMRLTISGPCEDIVKVFTPKDQISFDIREIERVQDGTYTWRLSRVATVDKGVQERLLEARGTGEEDALWWAFFQQGLIPEGPYVDSGSFTVDRGVIVDPSSGGEKSGSLAAKAGGDRSSSGIRAAVAGSLGMGDSAGEAEEPVLSTKDTVLTNANGVIRNSLCVGFDCANNNTYSDTTILLTENNTRIKFDDTSSINSFPRNDWEIEANSNLNGGASYLGFNDCGQSSGGGCATDLVFAVEAGVRQNALYVESDGDVGVGTANPAVRMHLIDGDTPALRLEQDGSSGFAPQTWDVAGNETSFFIRDVTSGSQLPFRIQPGAASNTLFIDSASEVGIGTSSPSERLHVTGSDGSNKILVEETSGTTTLRNLFTMRNNGGIQLLYDRTDGTSNDWQMSNFSATFELSVPGSSPAQFSLNANGNLTIGGTLTELSTREAKTNFESLDPRAVLSRVRELPISVWSYKQDTGSRHLGPMAEDFYEAFGLGSDNKTIAPGDKAGVALAAIQGLYAELEARDRQIAELQRQVEELSALAVEIEEQRAQQ